MALGRIGKDSEAAIPELAGLLGDKNERIGREASLALGRIGTAAVGPLVIAAAHKDPNIRACAVAGLGYLSEPGDKVYETVLRSAYDEMPAVRSQAVAALASLKVSDDILLPILSENLRHDERSCGWRSSVCCSTAGRLLSRMAKDLESLLTAENGGVVRHAGFLLARTGPALRPARFAA